jgi:hypothetical protein
MIHVSELANMFCTRVLQLSFSENGNGHISITCTSLAGEALCTVKFQERDSFYSIEGKIAEELAVSKACLKLVLPSGSLLDSKYGQMTHVSDLVNMQSSTELGLVV